MSDFKIGDWLTAPLAGEIVGLDEDTGWPIISLWGKRVVINPTLIIDRTLGVSFSLIAEHEKRRKTMKDACEPVAAQQPVYVVIGYEGEYSSLQVWVAAVYTDKDLAVAAAEEHKAEARSRSILWRVWNDEFGKRHTVRGLHGSYVWENERAQAIADLGMPDEPPQGNPDVEYTVAIVPLNTWGKWGYEDE